MQRKLHSAIEAIVNVMVGYCVATLATWFILPLFGYRVSVSDAFGISALFTVVSIVRSYALRRVFNRLTG
jgi:hypothetical protein